MTGMLEVRGLSYTINGLRLLDSIDMAIVPGRITVLIGPNGAGKSILLRLIAGELKPTSGEVLLDDRNIKGFSAAELGRRRAVVPQSSVLTFAFTVLEVAMLGVTVPGFGAATETTRGAALRALESVGMPAPPDQNYMHLSGGERQRVHIARALCQLDAAPVQTGTTRCFLLDEPTSSLDLAHQSRVLHAVRRQAQQGRAVLVILHDLNLASALADDLALLSRGAIVAAGTAEGVLRDATLTAAYGCSVYTNKTPGDERRFVLPPAVFE
jgi:iron complex transport system ATP-binding protein